MINSVVITGNLGKDPELTTSEGGTVITRFSIAVNEIRGKGNEKKTKTHWIDCVAFGPIAEATSTYVGKGSKVTVQGRLNQRKWENESGQMFNRLVVIVEKIAFMTKASVDSNNSEVEDDYEEATAA